MAAAFGHERNRWTPNAHLSKTFSFTQVFNTFINAITDKSSQMKTSKKYSLFFYFNILSFSKRTY